MYLHVQTISVFRLSLVSYPVHELRYPSKHSRIRCDPARSGPRSNSVKNVINYERAAVVSVAGSDVSSGGANHILGDELIDKDFIALFSVDRLYLGVMELLFHRYARARMNAPPRHHAAFSIFDLGVLRRQVDRFDGIAELQVSQENQNGHVVEFIGCVELRMDRYSGNISSRRILVSADFVRSEQNGGRFGVGTGPDLTGCCQNMLLADNNGAVVISAE